MAVIMAEFLTDELRSRAYPGVMMARAEDEGEVLY